MNAFFISCELINHPELKNKPLAIAGRAAIYNKGVVVTASYEARKFGVKAAMPVFMARKLCPKLIFISSNMDLYQEYSQKFIDFLLSYTPLVEKASIDEAYLDVTELCINQHPLELAKELQTKLLNEYHLPTSIGIATTKFLAKMASNMKKPLGITVLRNKAIKKLLWPLKIDKMHGIGKKTAPKLLEKGINTIGDLVKAENKTALTQILGNQYSYFYHLALGYGDNVVTPNKENDYKSIGNSTTFIDNIIVEEMARYELEKLTTRVVSRLTKSNYLTKTISVQIKYQNFLSQSKSKTLDRYVASYYEILTIVYDLFELLWNRKPIRLLGVSCSQLIEKENYYQQISIFDYENYLEDEKVIKLIHQINRKYGKQTIKKGLRLKK
jgi:DNA polymerase-4